MPGRWLPLLLLAPLLATAQPRLNVDPRAELRGRVVDAATGKPLAGAVVVASWETALPPNPVAVIILTPIGGHGSSPPLRLARVAEVRSDSDGHFVFPAWTQEEQINQGPILGGSPSVWAVALGYEPRSWSGGELKLERQGPRAVTSLTSFRGWLAANIVSADGEGFGDLQMVRPGDMREESHRAARARIAQQAAVGIMRQELARLDPNYQPPSPMWQSVFDPPQPGKIDKFELATSAPQSMTATPTGSAAVQVSATPQADAEQAFRAGKRQPLDAPVCGYVPQPDCRRAAKYVEDYNRTLLELARQAR